jgi:hypothetical protein
MRKFLRSLLAGAMIALGITVSAGANSVFVSGELPPAPGGGVYPMDVWYFWLSEPSNVTIDVLAYECWGYPEQCTDFFGNGVGNDLMDSVTWLGDAAYPPQRTSGANDGFIDVSDDGGSAGSGDGSVSILDSFLDVDLAAGEYVVSIESILGDTGGRYRITFTAADTDSLIIVKQVPALGGLGQAFVMLALASSTLWVVHQERFRREP